MISSHKGAVIVNAYWRGGDEGAREIAEAVKRRGVPVDFLRANEVDLAVGKGLLGSFPYDFCIYLDKDDHLARLLEKKGVRLFNSAESIRLADDKMLTHIALVGLPQPETLPSLLYFAGEDDATAAKKIGQRLGYPVVVKKCYGAFGKEVYLARNEEELRSLRAKLLKEPHLYQKYVECGGCDLRVITIGGKAVAAMKRRAVKEGEFRANAALGGKGERAEITEEIRALAESASRILGLEYAGVDLLFDKGSYLITEVNSNAQFQLLRAVTGVDVADLYAAHIVSEITKGEN